MIVNCYVKYKDYYVGHFMMNKPCLENDESKNKDEVEKKIIW